MYINRKLFLLFVILIFGVQFSFGQNRTKITIEQADELSVTDKLGDNVKRVIGNVIFRNENTLMYCDSAYLYDITNSLDAYGNVHINDGDTVDIWGDSLKYNGNTKVARMYSNVRMTDQEMTLTTDFLTYDMENKLGTYHSGGKIVNESNTLTSWNGYYYSESKQFFFRDSVVLVNPEYTMYSDTLMYNTNTEISYFYGPTDIISEENKIYCENGWYNTRIDISQFNKNARLIKEEQTITGDSLYYDRNAGLGKAFQNVNIIDTIQDYIIKGEYAIYMEDLGKSIVTDSAVAIFIDEKDSLFLHADTLKVLFDSLKEGKNMLAYHDVKFYRTDLQGVCDSLSYDFKDSTIHLFKDPILWSYEDQLTADSMYLVLVKNEIKTLVCRHSSFIIERDDTSNFNQIKGKHLTGYFENRELRRVKIRGNAETIYYVRDENDLLIGINKAVSSDLNIVTEKQKIKTITFIYEPVATLHPPGTLSPKDLKLKDFKWEEERRPANKYEIF